jgi:hypothetical protein
MFQKEAEGQHGTDVPFELHDRGAIAVGAETPSNDLQQMNSSKASIP